MEEGSVPVKRNILKLQQEQHAQHQGGGGCCSSWSVHTLIFNVLYRNWLFYQFVCMWLCGVRTTDLWHDVLIFQGRIKFFISVHEVQKFNKITKQKLKSLNKMFRDNLSLWYNFSWIKNWNLFQVPIWKQLNQELKSQVPRQRYTHQASSAESILINKFLDCILIFPIIIILRLQHSSDFFFLKESFPHFSYIIIENSYYCCVKNQQDSLTTQGMAMTNKYSY